MINKKMFKSAAVITAVMLSVSGCAGGCSKQAEPVIADSAAETPEPEESIESSEPIPSPTVESTEEPEGEASEESFTVTDMDVTMVVNVEAFTYETPSSEGLRVGAAQKDELVHVIGQVDGTNWFKIEQGNGETDDIIVSFIDGEFLSEYTEPEEETPSESETPAETPAETEKPAEKPQQPAETQQPQQPAQTEQPPAQPQQPAEQPSDDGNDGPPPGVNIGDVVGENVSGVNDPIWGGEIDYSGF